MIVVDVGCLDHGGEPSIPTLVRKFRPDVLFGFDPHPMLQEGLTNFEGTPVYTRRLAAWTKKGVLPYDTNGNMSGVIKNGPPLVPCFDLPTWLMGFPEYEVILKLNIEGGEYPLLRRIASTGVDRRLDRLIVAWHTPEMAHGFHSKKPYLNCRVDEWSADSFL